MVRIAKPYQRSESYRKANPDAPGSWKHDLHEEARNTSLAARLSNSGGSRSGRGHGSDRDHPSAASSSSSASLLARMSGGKGKELLPSGVGKVRLHGFDGPVPVNANNPSNLNSGLELLPSSGPARSKGAGGGRGGGMKSGPVGGRLVDRSVVDAALGRSGNGQSARRERPRELLPSSSYSQPQAQAHTFQQPVHQQQQQHVSIMGAAKAATVVRVDNLAAGTTAEDVLSAFSHLPVINAKLAQSSSPSQSSNVAVDIEMETRAAAEDLIKQYDGVVADGNTLSVVLVNMNQSLRDRLGAGKRDAPPSPAPAPRATASAGNGSGNNGNGNGFDGRSTGRELLGAPSSGKLYSDTILSTNPRAAIITLSPDDNPSRNSYSRSDSWAKGAPSLVERLNGVGALGARRAGW